MERRAAVSPTALAAIDEHGARLHFGELHAAALSLAATLHARGATRDARVAWLLPTRLDALILTAALARLGAVQIPLMPTYGRRELAFILEQARPVLLLLPRRFKQLDLATLVEDAAADARLDAPVETLDTLLQQRSTASLPTAPPASRTSQDAPVRWIFYTSGTTAAPKGALHTDATLAASARGLDAPHRFVPEDRVSLVFPYAHIGGPGLLFSALMVGHALILSETFEKEVVMRALSEGGVTLAGPGPAFWQAFIDAQRARPERRLFPELRALIGGGAAKPANLHREAREVLGVEILSGYGLTECPALAYNWLGDPDEVLASDGRAVLGAELEVVDAEGRSLPPHEEGEIRVRGDMRFKGYLDASLDAEAIDDEGWVRTGDLGRLDERGQLRVTGRKKDIIIRKGENISAREIEDLLALHPRVREVAVIGLPDAERGERCCAVVVTRDGAAPLTLDEIGTHCLAAGLMKIKLPEQVEHVDALPVNTTGKVLKAALRARFAGAAT